MLHSSINSCTLVAAPLSRCHPASIPILRPSPTLPITFPRHIRLSRGGSSKSPAMSCNALARGIKGGQGINVFHEVEMKVRDYELNQYGVVNDAVYASYCQQGYYELLERICASAGVIVIDGDALAMTELSLNFIAPLRSGDRFIVKVRISSFSAARLSVEHSIFKKIVEARATAVWLDKNYRPARIPPHVLSYVVQFSGHQKSS